MKNYVWTYWTKPQNGLSRTDLACLGLSVALAAVHGHASGIHTDSAGARQIEKYFIGAAPIVSLDSLINENPGKYALAKIHTYQKIKSPCVHIDHDVFLRKEQLFNMRANFYVQSLERKSAVYKLACEYFASSTGRLPSEVRPFFHKKDFCGYNMGYFEINNLGFLATYAERSINLFGSLNNNSNNYLNIFCEQYLFYCMTKACGISVETILGDKAKNWDTAAHRNSYAHLMSGKSYGETFGDVMKELSIKNQKCYEAIQSGY